jgi:hypothetical protein
VYGAHQGLAMTGKVKRLEAWPLQPVSADRLTT